VHCVDPCDERIGLSSSVQDALVDALVQRKVLVCVGPGLAIAAGLPGPRVLVERCREADGRLTVAPGAGVARALEQAEHVLGSVPFQRVVREAWEQEVPLPAMAKALVGLAPWLNTMLTCNLDRLLECAFNGRWPAIEVAAPDVARRSRVIFKIRGTIDRPSGWLLTARQQENAGFFGTVLQGELAALLRSHVVLFVGFEADDEEFLRLLAIRGQPVADPQRHGTETMHPDVALVPATTCTPEAQSELGRRGVLLVPLADDAAVTGYLAALAGELARRTGQVVPVSADEVEAGEPDEESPYPGLESFTEERRRFFFGREDDVARILERLGTAEASMRRWLLLDGPSGAGKSSLLHAGLVPALRDGVGEVVGAPTVWRVVTMRPGPAPVVELALQVHRSLTGEVDGASALAAEVQRFAPGLGAFIAEKLGAGEGLLLVVDQLEEALLVEGADVRAAFAAALAELLVRPPRPVLLVTGLRSDFSGELPLLPALHERMTSASPPVRYTLATLTPTQLAAAVERPARAARVMFEPGLAGKMLADAGSLEEGGRDKVSDTALPLVAVLLAELYSRRAGRLLTHAAYEASGGVAGALSRRADATLEPLARTVGETRLWQFFRALFQMDAQGRVARCPLTRSDAVAALGGGAAAEGVLARLTGGGGAMRVLFVRGGGVAARVDLVHDALLRSWTWLRARIEADRVELLREAEVTQAAERWRRLGRPRDGLPSGGEAEYFLRASMVPGSLAEGYQAALRAHMRQRRNVVRAVVGVLAVGVLALAGAAIYALYQRSEAEEQTQLAEERLTAANIVVNDMLFDVLPRLDAIPGTGAVRKQIHGKLEGLQQTLLSSGRIDTWAMRNRMAQNISRGDLALTHDDLGLARTEYAAGLRIAEELFALSPKSAQAQRDLSLSVDKLGRVEVLAGNLAGARAHFDRSLVIDEALAKADPDSAFAQRDLSLSLDNLGDVEAEAGNLAGARAHFNRSLAVREALAKADPDSAQAQRDLSTSLERLGNVEVKAGNLANARAHFDRSHAVVEALAKADPGSAQAQRDLSVSLNKLGDVEVKAGHLTGARAHFDRSHALAEALAKADPDSTQAQRDLSLSLDNLGDVEVEAGNLAGARAHFDRSLTIKEALARADPDSVEAQRDLSISLDRLGDVEVEAGNLAGARAHFDRSLTIKEALAKAHPDSAQAQSDLSAILGKLGNVEVVVGNLAKARAHFDRSLAVREVLAKADPDSAQAQRDLSLSLNNLGNVEVEAGNLADARAYFDRSLAVREALAKADTDSAQAQRDLSVSLNKLGDVEVEAGNLADAQTHFDRSLTIDEALAKADPDSAQARRDLSISLSKLGGVEVQTGNLAGARAHFDRSLTIKEALAKADPGSAQAQRDLSFSLEGLGDVEVQADNLASARAHFDRSLAIREALAKADPDSAQAQRDITASLDRLGNVEVQADNLAGARAHFDRSFAVREVLARADPDSVEVSFELAISHMALYFLAYAEKDSREMRMRLTAADAILDVMATNGQLVGYARREVVRNLVNDQLARLK